MEENATMFFMVFGGRDFVLLMRLHFQVPAVVRGDVYHCMSTVSFLGKGLGNCPWVVALSRVSRSVLKKVASGQLLWSMCYNVDIHIVKVSVENNNNNTIWGGSVLTGEEPPHHSEDLKHALTQAGGPTQSQLSRPMSSGHHISMEHRLRRKQLNSDTNASNKTYLKEIQEQRKEETFSSEKMKKENEKH